MDAYRFWFLHLLEATHTYELLGLNMCWEMYDMMEDTLLSLERAQPISLEAAEKLLKAEKMWLKSVKDV